MQTRIALAFVLLALVPAPVWAEKPRLAVMDLAAKSGIEQAQLDVLGDMLATEIRNVGKHEVVTKSDISAMIGLERTKELLSCDDASCMAEIGGALGVELMVTGNVGRFGNVYAVNLKLINVKKAKVENSVFRKVEGGEQALLDDFAYAVRVLIGVSATPPSTSTAYAPGPSVPAHAADQSGALAPLGFTAEQISRMRHVGVRINSDTVQASRRLLKRDFTTDELTIFITEHKLSLRDAREAEQYVLYVTAGLSDRDFMRFYKRIKRSDLTEYYNNKTESKALGAMKWVCFGLGLATGLLGVPFYLIGNDSLGDSSLGSAGAGMMAVGGILFGTSITLMIIDGVNIGNLPDRFFDTAKKGEILKAVDRPGVFGRASADQPSLNIALSPFVDTDGRAGLAFGVQF